MKKIIACLLICWINASYANVFPLNTAYEVCFTPGGNCTAQIVNEINKAQKSIYVQAYSFTSAPILAALNVAKRKGVEIKVILDKSQVSAKGRYTSATFLSNNNIPAYLDYKPAIAHNKVMILDGTTLITGSFNFTKAAAERNAENLLIIHDKQLASIYQANWNKRFNESLDLSNLEATHSYVANKHRRKRYQW